MSKYRVKLTDSERTEFEQLTQGKRGRLKIAVWKLQRIQALLLCDESEQGPAWEDHQIAQSLGVTIRTLENWRKQAVLQGPHSLLERKKRQMPATAAKLDGEGEARLVQLACSQPPEGYARWSMRLLAEEMVVLEVVDSIDRETVRRTLKKTN